MDNKKFSKQPAHFDYYECLTLSPNSIYNYYNLELDRENVTSSEIEASCLIITTGDVIGEFENDISVEIAISKKENNQFEIISDFVTIFNLNLNNKDPFFYRFKNKFKTELLKIKSPIVPGNFISFFIKTNNFPDKKYFIKDCYIELFRKIDKTRKENVVNSSLDNSKQQFIGNLALHNNLLGEVLSFFDLKDLIMIRNVSRRFRNIAWIPKRFICNFDKNGEYESNNKTFLWCNQEHTKIMLPDDIQANFVTNLKIEVTSRDQGWGLTEHLSWVEMGIIDENNVEQCKREKICDNPRRIETNSMEIGYNNIKYSNFLSHLKPGNIIVIYARCATGGWECIINNVRIDLTYISRK